MSWFSKPKTDKAADKASTERLQAWDVALNANGLPEFVRERLSAAAQSRTPWLSTMTAPELLLARSHGMRPIATVTGSCWMQLGNAPTRGYEQGLRTAQERLIAEARLCSANAVVDVKLRTIANMESGYDFTLMGTAVRMDGLPPSDEPVIATTSALEFVRLLEAGIVPVGIAIGTHSSSIVDSRMSFTGPMSGIYGLNQPLSTLGEFWESIRRTAHHELRQHAAQQGNGVLAHTHMGQIMKVEGGDKAPDRYIARHIVIGTVVDTRSGHPVPHEITSVVDMLDDLSPLKFTPGRSQRGFTNNEREREI